MSDAVSELLTAAAGALDVPEPLVERSAAARAAANGSSVDDVLAAWAGGATVAPAAPAAATPPPAPAEAALVAAAVEESPAPEPAVAAAPVMVMEQPEPEPEVVLEPIPLGRRVRTAVRVGAWTGAGLGLLGFVAATSGWASGASVTGEGPAFVPVIQANSNSVIIGIALVSIVFGAVAAGLSRAAASWANPGMQLSSSPSSTAWIGAAIGLLLGVIAGSALTSGFGTPVEGAEGVVQMPVLATLAVMVIGGAVLGGLTAAITQVFGVPVAVPEDDDDHVRVVRRRLSSAIGIPVTGIILLLLLVLPFAWALLESNHLTSGGAAVIGILTAGGILSYASLAGSRPNIKLGFGEVMVAVVGIGIVVVVILAVLFARSPDEEHEEPAAEPEAAVTLVIG